MRPGVFIPKDLKPQPKNHEILTAQCLARHGYYVEFMTVDRRVGAKSADILLNGISFEMKSPTGGISAIERNLKRATKQSSNVVMDTRRMSLTDSRAIKNEFERKIRKQKIIKRVIFINRYGHLVDLHAPF